MSTQGLGNFIWSIADQLRGVYRPAQYGTATLPFVILRRMDRPKRFPPSVLTFGR